MRFLTVLILCYSLTVLAEDATKNILPQENAICDIPAAAVDMASLGASMMAVADSLLKECPVRPPVKDNFSGLETLGSVQKKAEEIFKAMGLNAKFEGKIPLYQEQKTNWAWSTFSETPDDVVRLKKIINSTVAAFADYPKDFLKNSEMNDIFFAKDLKVGGKLRKALPDALSKSLVFADNNDVGCAAGMELRVHHEVFHYIEARFAKKIMLRKMIPDSEWSKLNFGKTSYQKAGGTLVYRDCDSFENNGHASTGYVSKYAMSAVEEDKAETFAWMMTRGYAERSESFASVDPVLAEKQRRIRLFVKTRLAGSMNESYYNEKAKAD